MLLIYQMNFYKWYFRVAGRSWCVCVCVCAMEIKQKYESMSNCPWQRRFECDLCDGRKSNSIDQFWWTSFGQSSNRFRAHFIIVNFVEMSWFWRTDPHWVCYFTCKFIYSFAAPQTKANDVLWQFIVCAHCIHFDNDSVTAIRKLAAQLSPAQQKRNTIHHPVHYTWIRADLKSFELLVFILFFLPSTETEHIFAWIHRAHRREFMNHFT